MDDRPTYTVQRAPRAPELEGHDDLWHRAEPAEVAHAHPESSEHHPQTTARLLYDDTHLYLRFDVDDRYVIARNTEPNSPVYEDSCVEFFFQIHPNRYINLEMNAIGAILLGSWQEEPREGGVVDPKHIEAIKRWTSLSGPIEEEIIEPITWHAALALPLSVIEDLAGPLKERKPAPDIRWTANFYKCADKSSHPHWLTWSPIGERLWFHQPKYFGHLHFA
ncbi:carbohydrate-binding family 9-like protein [Mucisphaera sp.]|uniref:carbohydrate-binding family 9-like protein n=1 Tax=Mucisphaera sp. TaxID=2913024 RepID=UPI003D14A8D3